MAVLKPILFNTEMVRAILDGRKTVMRRVVKPQPKGHAALLRTDFGEDAVYAFEDGTVTSPPYRPGDILYVRETWNCLPIPEPLRGTSQTYWYKADESNPEDKWRPSIHMPREAARIFLRVTNVRVERLKSITSSDAMDEGFTDWNDLVKCWNSTIKPADRALYGWDANPWVWVIEFERINKEDAMQWNKS